MRSLGRSRSPTSLRSRGSYRTYAKTLSNPLIFVTFVYFVVHPLLFLRKSYLSFTREFNALMELIEKQALTYSELVTVPAEEYEDAF